MSPALPVISFIFPVSFFTLPKTYLQVAPIHENTSSVCTCFVSFFIYTYRLRVAHDERGTVLSIFFFLFFFLALLIFITISVYKTITHLRASQSLKVNELNNNIIYIYIFVFLSSTECPLQRFNHGCSSSSRAEGLVTRMNQAEDRGVLWKTCFNKRRSRTNLLFRQ